MILPAVLLRLNLAQIAFPDEIAHLVCSIWRRNSHKDGKFVDRRTLQRLDGFHAEGLHRGQASLPALKALEDLLVKMELEFVIHIEKSILQHVLPRTFPLYVYIYIIANFREYNQL